MLILRTSIYYRKMEETNEKKIKEQIILERNEASIFKNNTQINEELINRFYKFYKYKVRRLDFISFLICGVVLVVLAICNLIKGSNQVFGIILNITSSIALTVIGIGFGVSAFQIQKFDKKTMEKVYNEDISNLKNEYYFQDDKIIIVNKYGETERVYEYLDSIYEDKKCYYIFTNKKSSYILKKDSFITGEENDFNLFIKEKMGRNYKKRCRRKV